MGMDPITIGLIAGGIGLAGGGMTSFMSARSARQNVEANASAQRKAFLTNARQIQAQEQIEEFKASNRANLIRSRIRVAAGESGIGYGGTYEAMMSQADYDEYINREIIGALSRERAVLNCFCYTGGFSIAALSAGAAEVASVDSSAPALARVAEHIELNHLGAAPHEAIEGDVNQTLRRFLDAGRRFDAIVLDPPKFAPTAAHAERASRAYKDINRLALMLLEPGGALFTFSCSGGIGPELFHKIIAGAGIDAGVDALFYARMGAAPDHATTLLFPEGEYLKGLALIKA